MCFVEYHYGIIFKILRNDVCNFGIDDILIAVHNHICICDKVPCKEIGTPGMRTTELSGGWDKQKVIERKELNRRKLPQVIQ